MTSRKQFLLQVAGLAAVATAASASEAKAAVPKILIVVAHPDDEYAFAASIYRIAKEHGGVVDQVVLTNGEAGYRYSRLAETYYGLALTREDVGRSNLPAIRREETLRAGRIIGIRNHYFLDQKDARFTLDGTEAFSGIWDVNSIRDRVAALCEAEKYDFVLGLLPTPETHGHHQAATLLALQAVLKLPADIRPVVLASEPTAGSELPTFTGRPDIPALRPEPGAPVYSVSRLDAFGPGGTMNYNIVVNWLIAEYKTQGLFQTECGKHTQENFWLLDSGTRDAIRRTSSLFETLRREK